MSLLIASLYLLCLAFLFGSALYVYSRDPYDPLNSSYALLALSVLGWVGSLFVFNAQATTLSLLLLGRFNFAAAAVAAPAVYIFVHTLARKLTSLPRWLWFETGSLAILTLFTGAVDAAEKVGNSGEHITVYGFLFPLYVLHILGFVIAALLIAFRPSGRLTQQTKQQLLLVGLGVLITTTVGVITNAILPYFYRDFRYSDLGTLSTIFFLGAVAYAASIHHLFHVRVIVRATLVFGLLIAFALELYQLAIEFFAHLLPLGDPTERHVAAAAVAITINAFTHEQLRLWLERIFDQLLKGKEAQKQSARKLPASKNR